MSDTKKEGKRGWRAAKHADVPVGMETRAAQILCLRHSFGSTEKILRRNADLWRRLLGKARREADKLAIKDELEGCVSG